MDVKQERYLTPTHPQNKNIHASLMLLQNSERLVKVITIPKICLN